MAPLGLMWENLLPMEPADVDAEVDRAFFDLATKAWGQNLKIDGPVWTGAPSGTALKFLAKLSAWQEAAGTAASTGGGKLRITPPESITRDPVTGS